MDTFSITRILLIQQFKELGFFDNLIICLSFFLLASFAIFGFHRFIGLLGRDLSTGNYLRVGMNLHWPHGVLIDQFDMKFFILWLFLFLMANQLHLKRTNYNFFQFINKFV